MTEEGKTGWSRREFGGAAALLALAVGLPAVGAYLSYPDEDEAPSERQIALMESVAQLVIPRTQTPGAGDVHAGAFAILALAHGLDGTLQPVSNAQSSWAIERFQRPDGSLRYVDWLESVLDRRANDDWFRRTDQERVRLLSALDAEAFEDGGDGHPWKAIKALILTGYYTTEAGGSEELRYEPVPGRFDSKVPQEIGTRAISNDWTAVEFG